MDYWYCFFCGHKNMSEAQFLFLPTVKCLSCGATLADILLEIEKAQKREKRR